MIQLAMILDCSYLALLLQWALILSSWTKKNFMIRDQKMMELVACDCFVGNIQVYSTLSYRWLEGLAISTPIPLLITYYVLVMD